MVRTLSAALVLLLGLYAHGASTELAQPLTVTTAGPATRLDTGAAAALMAQARQDRHLNVLVEIVSPPPLEESSGDISETLADRQGRILREVLGDARSISQAHAYEDLPVLAMEVSPAQFRRLLRHGDVLRVQEDVPLKPSLSTSTKQINAPKLWNKGLSGSPWTIGVIDTGFKVKHPMLKSRVIDEACFATNNNRYESQCRNNQTNDTGPGAAKNCRKSIPSKKNCGHGTHVASIAAGSFKKRRGVAPGANLAVIKILSKDRQTGEYWGLSSDALKALNHLYTNRNSLRLAAVNMSFGYDHYQANCDNVLIGYRQLISRFKTASIAVVAASGNDSDSYVASAPACMVDVIAAGAVTKKDILTDFSNHSYMIDLLAPGNRISAAWPEKAAYRRQSGTSQAAPHVAGAFALLKSAHGKQPLHRLLTGLYCSGKLVSKREDAEDSIVARPRINLHKANSFLKTYAEPLTWGGGDGWKGWTVLSSEYARLVRGRTLAVRLGDGTPGNSGDLVLANKGACGGSFSLTITFRAVLNPYVSHSLNEANLDILTRSTLPASTKTGQAQLTDYYRTSIDISKYGGKDNINKIDFWNSVHLGGSQICGSFIPANPLSPNKYRTLKITQDDRSYTVTLDGVKLCDSPSLSFSKANGHVLLRFSGDESLVRIRDIVFQRL